MQAGIKAGKLIGLMSIVILIYDRNTAFTGARTGVRLCLESVIPSMLPFILLSTAMSGAFQNSESKIMRVIGRFLGLPKELDGLLIPAFAAGYPVGADAVGQAHRKGIVTASDAEKLLCFCNNAGPAFIFGMAARQFEQNWAAPLIFAIQFMTVLCFARHYFVTATGPISQPSRFSITDAAQHTMHALSKICIWIVVFQIILAYLQKYCLSKLPFILQTAIMGALELSSGCLMLHLVKSWKLRMILCCMMLSFGGVCVLLQTKAVVQELALRKYVAAKLLQSIISGVFCTAILMLDPGILLLLAGILALCLLFKNKAGFLRQAHI